MKLIPAFLRLIRWPNLVFIALTQVLLYYSLVEPLTLKGIGTSFLQIHLILLITASVLIAAAGYIINDYFDLNIDQVNKPGRMIIGKVIKRRWAIAWHILLSLAGLIISFYISYQLHSYWLGLSNLACIFLLFGYSITLKKKLLLGNILISVLTAWVIVVAFLCYYQSLYCNGCYATNPDSLFRRFIKISFLYAGFAFVISLIREVVKDMEDREGDTKYGCRTMPIVWGIPASKVFVAVWIIVLIGTLGVVQFYVLQFGWWWSAVYCFLLIIIPLLWIIQKLYRANVPKDYHQLSTGIKLVMFTGILSMLFFKIYS